MYSHKTQTKTVNNNKEHAENQFMLAVKEVKKEIGNDYATAQALTGFMQTTLEQAAAQEKGNEKPEQ